MVSKEQIYKLAESEIKLFDNVEKEYPFLNEYRGKVLVQFKLHYESILNLVINAHKGSLFSHSLVMNGAIIRSLNVYRGAIWALGERNPHILFSSLRFQCETLALIHYCILNPKYVEVATIGSKCHKDKELKIVHISIMIDELDKKYKGIKQDYASLCELVHPNPASLYANLLVHDESKNGKGVGITFGTKSPRITDKEAKRYVLLLIYWTEWILEELEEMCDVFIKLIK